jgi:AcrR family transcriptional regulator
MARKDQRRSALARTAESARTGLSRERVLGAAVDLADAEGIGAVTMRRLAARLGVEAMSLYHWVGGKSDLLDAIVDVVLAEIDLPANARDWKTALRETALSAHDVLSRHEWAAAQMNASAAVKPARLRWMEFVLATLRDAGFTPEMTDHAYHALDSHVTGFALWLASLRMPTRAHLAAAGSAFLRELPVETYPRVAEHVEQHVAARPPEDGGEFAFGLDLILDGLERLRDAQRTG